MTCWSKHCLGWIKYSAGQCQHISPLRHTPAHQSCEPRQPCLLIHPATTFCFYFWHYSQQNQKKISYFMGNGAFWFAWSQCFPKGFLGFFIYTQAYLFICTYDTKDTYSGKQKNVSHCLNMPPFWRILLSEKKFTEFPLVCLNSFKCCASRQTENLAYPQLPPLCSTFNRLLLWPQKRQQPLLKL